jgi:hypothetical protein
MGFKGCTHPDGLLKVFEKDAWRCIRCDQLFVEIERMPEPIVYRPASEYHEDMGTVLWWHLPVEEPPTVDRLLEDENDVRYYTHWTPLVMPKTNGAELLKGGR